MTFRRKNKSGIFFDIFFVAVAVFNMSIFFKSPEESFSDFNLLIALILAFQILSNEIAPKNYTEDSLKQIDAKVNNITFITSSIMITISGFVHYVLTNGIEHTFYPEIWQILLLVTLLFATIKFIAKVILILHFK